MQCSAVFALSIVTAISHRRRLRLCAIVMMSLLFMIVHSEECNRDIYLYISHHKLYRMHDTIKPSNTIEPSDLAESCVIFFFLIPYYDFIYYFIVSNDDDDDEKGVNGISECFRS